MKLFICKFNKILIAVIALISLAACGSSNKIADVNSEQPNAEPVNQGMLQEAEIDYEYSEMKPSILVDLNGYEVGNDKEAVLEGERFPSYFRVRRVNDDEIVYTSNLYIKECSEDANKLTAIADFTEFDEIGEYYIEAEILGRSKNFKITEGTYKAICLDMFHAINKSRSTKTITVLHEDGLTECQDVNGGWVTSEDDGRDVYEGCLTALDMMMAYEYHSSVYTDDFGVSESGNNIPDLLDEIRFETDWIMKMQNKETGGVYNGIYKAEGDSKLLLGGETTKATAYACATLARFSYIYKKFDYNYSNECYLASVSAWNCLMANKDIVAIEQLYRAAVEMYRATGMEQYQSVINDYLSVNAGKEYETRTTLDAAITYMATPRKLDVKYCNALMEQYMDRTEKKAESARASRYMVESEQPDFSVLLRNANELVMVDYIISNQEYERMEENYVHFLAGRNPDSYDYIHNISSLDEYAKLLLLTGKLSDENIR